MKLPSIPYLAGAFAAVLRRFPWVMLSAFVGTIAAILLIEGLPKEYEKEHARLLFTAALALPLFLSAAVASEKWQLSGTAKWLPSVAALLLAVLYFFTMDMGTHGPSPTTMMRFAGLNLAAHLLVAWLPYAGSGTTEDFWEYNKRLLVNFLTGAFYSLVIYAGLGFAILAVQQLFDLRINNNIYAHLFVVIAGVFNTAYFLAHYPPRYEGLAEEGGQYTTAVKNLTKFILIPIVAIYFLILYAYSVKIIATWELPRGWVSSLVLGFSVAGIFTYLLNFFLVKYDDGSIVRNFKRWFFVVLLPMVVLLFVAIGRRIGDYGVTEERYIVATAGVWLLLVSLYFVLSKKDDIRFIPLSLTLFALVTVLGPFSAFKSSERSQVGRLEAILTKNNMLEEGRAVPAKDSLSQEDAADLQSILYYLQNNGHFSPVALWFGLSPDIDSPEWEDMSEIMTNLKLGDAIGAGPQEYCYAYFPQETGMAIAGYDTLHRAAIFAQSFRNVSGFTIVQGENTIEWRRDGELIDRFDLNDYVTRLAGRYDCVKGDFKQEDSAVEVAGGLYAVKFIAENLTIKRGEKPLMQDWNGSILIRRKE